MSGFPLPWDDEGGILQCFQQSKPISKSPSPFEREEYANAIAGTLMPDESRRDSIRQPGGCPLGGLPRDSVSPAIANSEGVGIAAMRIPTPSWLANWWATKPTLCAGRVVRGSLRIVCWSRCVRCYARVSRPRNPPTARSSHSTPVPLPTTSFSLAPLRPMRLRVRPSPFRQWPNLSLHSRANLIPSPPLIY